MTVPIPIIDDEKNRSEIIGLLRRGGVVVLPTDTLYGLSTAISSRQGVRRIDELKGRRDRKGYILLAESIAMVARYVASFGCVGRPSLERVWPAPLTVVFPAGSACPDWVGARVAFRVPALDHLRDLISGVGEPILSTSVNRSGEPPLDTPARIQEAFGALVDAIVAGTEGAGAVASTVVDATAQRPVVLRKGAYDWEAAGWGNPAKR